MKLLIQEYIINIEQNGLQWSIQRRYTDFRLLHASITSNASGIEVEFPGKKITGNKVREFIAQRQMALENFLANVVAHPVLRHSWMLKSFLNPLLFSTSILGKNTRQNIINLNYTIF